MAMKVPMMEVGMAREMMAEARTLRRKKSTTKMARIPPISPELATAPMERTTKSPVFHAS